MRTQTPFDITIQKICRALCDVNRVPENGYIRGLPVWQTFRADALTILAKLNEGDVLPNGLVVGPDDDGQRPARMMDGQA
jgi:hypothetical protein